MGPIWRLVVLLLVTIIHTATTTDLCQIGIEVNGRTGTLCASPYCTCNNPYGRVFCTCLPINETIPQISSIRIQSAGSCHVPPETRDLVLSDCQNVTFTPNGLEPLQFLRTIQVSNVQETTLEAHALKWNASTAGLAILFSNTTVAHVPSYTLSGRISKLVFRDVYLGLIKPFAFANLYETDRIQFVGCNFANIEAQAFKKFATNNLMLESNRFHVIPSRFFHEIHVHNLFRVDSNFIDESHTLAFQVIHPTETIISSNRVNLLKGESISVQARGRIVIRDNNFETVEPAAFRAITADRHIPFSIPPDFVFDNNTLGTFSETSLLFNNAEFTVRLSRVHIDDTCSCDNLVKWRETVFPAKRDFPGPVEAHLTDIWCHEESTKEVNYDFIQGDTYYGNHCTQLLSSIYFFVIIIVTTTVGLCVLIMVCICILRRRRHWDTVPTSETAVKTPKKGLVVPDGRVYRETEFHVIVEKAEPLDEITPYRVTRDRSRPTMFTRDPAN